METKKDKDYDFNNISINPYMYACISYMELNGEQGVHA